METALHSIYNLCRRHAQAKIIEDLIKTFGVRIVVATHVVADCKDGEDQQFFSKIRKLIYSGCHESLTFLESAQGGDR